MKAVSPLSLFAGCKHRQKPANDRIALQFCFILFALQLLGQLNFCKAWPITTTLGAFLKFSDVVKRLKACILLRNLPFLVPFPPLNLKVVDFCIHGVPLLKVTV